jgi:cell division septation protein DedD
MSDTPAVSPHGATENEPLPWLRSVDEDEGSARPAGHWGKWAAGVAAAAALAVLIWFAAYRAGPPTASQSQTFGSTPTAIGGGPGEIRSARRPVLEPAIPDRPRINKAPPAKSAHLPDPRPAPASSARTPPAATGRLEASGHYPTIQLGAFPNERRAEAGWQTLPAARRERLKHQVLRARVQGRTVYRLRASGPTALAVCRSRRALRQPCFVVRKG